MEQRKLLILRAQDIFINNELIKKLSSQVLRARDGWRDTGIQKLGEFLQRGKRLFGFNDGGRVRVCGTRIGHNTSKLSPNHRKVCRPNQNIQEIVFELRQNLREKKSNFVLIKNKRKTRAYLLIRFTHVN
jgi:hypothetical protein